MNALHHLNEFILSELEKNHFRLIQISEKLMETRLEEIMRFVNLIRAEHGEKYGWTVESKEYFLNPMDRKFSYSYLIENNNNEIISLSLFSVYGEMIHNHCTYVGEKYRNRGLAKLLLINLCYHSILNGFQTYSGFFPKENNRSLILFLRLGLKIDYIRNNSEIFGTCNLEEMALNAYNLYSREIKSSVY